MAPPQFKVIIVGGGIVGLSLGVMLERAGIEYLILEACSDVRPLGSIVYLGPPILRSFEQLGLLDDIVRQSNRMTGVTLMDHKLNKVCRINTDFAKDRYGYDTLTIVRPKLHDILLSRIPAYKILFGKRVTSMAQNGDGTKVRCEDGSAYNGDIIVASDGGASPIRKAIYEAIKSRSKKLAHPADYAQPKLDQRCIAGVSEPLSIKQFPILDEKTCELVMIMPKEINCMIWIAPVAERRFGWGITSPLPSSGEGSSQESDHLRSRGSLESGFSTRTFSAMSSTTYSPSSTAPPSPSQLNYGEDRDYISSIPSTTSSNIGNQSVSSNFIKKRQSTSRLSKHSTSSNGSQRGSGFQRYPPVLQLTEPSSLELNTLPFDRVWGKLDEKYNIEDSIREQPTPFGGCLGDIIDATSRKMISTVIVEEKFYHTWHFGRTVLLGDACHKLLPSSGHGTTQGILDAISLSSLLTELPSNNITDIDALFRLQYERRGPSAKAAVISSKKQDQMLFNRKLSGKIIRKMASSWVSDWLLVKLGDRIFEGRPILTFLKPVPDRGYHKNKENNVPLVDDKRYEIARRKSIASGYLNGGTGSYLLGGKEDPSAMDMEFDAALVNSYSLNTSKVLELQAMRIAASVSHIKSAHSKPQPVFMSSPVLLPEIIALIVANLDTADLAIAARINHDWSYICIPWLYHTITVNTLGFKFVSLEIGKLERLVISNLQGSQSVENNFFEASFRGSEQIKELCITGSNLITNRALVGITNTCPNISVMDLSGDTCLTEAGLSEWCQQLKLASVYTKLTTLNFANCNRIRTEGFEALFKQSRNLVHEPWRCPQLQELRFSFNGWHLDLIQRGLSSPTLNLGVMKKIHPSILENSRRLYNDHSNSEEAFHDPYLEHFIFGGLENDISETKSTSQSLNDPAPNNSIPDALLNSSNHSLHTSSATKTEYRQRLVLAQIYQQIEQLTRLQILDVRGIRLPLNIASGFGRLGALENLKTFECHGLITPMGESEVDWLIGLEHGNDLCTQPLPKLTKIAFKNGHGIPKQYLQKLGEHRPLIELEFFSSQ
ncbi:hypothetical protein BGZ76_008172 [Entomortierella beljakovae]|nr:hypothetical protein BGZ76_008172 [Entomortierella beljakovae]